LLGQTIALGLNIRINGGALASLPITGAYFTTYAGSGTGCGSQGTATPGTGRTYSIPQAVIDYLNANTAIYPGGATVGNVFKLASDVLGRVALPGTVPTLSQLTGACGAFNEGFDGCRILGSFSATAPASSRNVTIDQSGSTDQMIALGVSAKAFPNPFATTTTIEFVLADYSSNVAVEIFSLNGEKVATLFAGELNGGEVKRVEFNGAELANGIYVYRITSTDRTFYDKLILNR
ncbi:MAG: T9SS type A sorting domain-containing protein, partial [Flavobacteriales bacterium]